MVRVEKELTLSKRAHPNACRRMYSCTQIGKNQFASILFNTTYLDYVIEGMEESLLLLKVKNHMSLKLLLVGKPSVTPLTHEWPCVGQ